MRRTILVAGLLAMLGASSCSAPVRKYVCTADPQNAAGVDVHALWACNRDVLHRASRKKPFSLREFRKAAAFFEGLTGFQIDTRPSHLGALPGSELREDVSVLDAWYKINRDKLRWDTGLGKIVYEGLAPPVCRY